MGGHESDPQPESYLQRLQSLPDCSYLVPKVIPKPKLYIVPSPEGYEDNVIEIPIRITPPDEAA